MVRQQSSAKVEEGFGWAHAPFDSGNSDRPMLVVGKLRRRLPVALPEVHAYGATVLRVGN